MTAPAVQPAAANAPRIEELNVALEINYNWDYDDDRKKLMRLYENAKRDQWNSSTRLDWSIDVDPRSELLPDMGIGIWGTPMWEKLTAREVEKLRHEALTWQLSQFLHGEQGALLVTAQLVDSVPWYEAKMYGATQVMDEARHVEVFSGYVNLLDEVHPIPPGLKKILDAVLESDDWMMKAVGMQIIVEGLALAAFGTIRDSTTCPLLKELTTGVIEDEARHVAFGVLALRERALEYSDKEREEREDFIYEACVLMRDRITNREVWETMGMDPDACIDASDQSPIAKEFRYRLFSKIVPNVKSLGLLSDKQRVRFEDLGILQFENETTSDVDHDALEEQRMLAGDF